MQQVVLNIKSVSKKQNLFFQDATLNILYKDKIITAIGLEFLLNNKLISGTFGLPLENLTDSHTLPSKIKIIAGTSHIDTTIEEFEQHLKNIG